MTMISFLNIFAQGLSTYAVDLALYSSRSQKNLCGLDTCCIRILASQEDRRFGNWLEVLVLEIQDLWSGFQGSGLRV